MFVGSAKPAGEMSHDVGVAIADSLVAKVCVDFKAS
jgi:hypothetical protein